MRHWIIIVILTWKIFKKLLVLLLKSSLDFDNDWFANRLSRFKSLEKLQKALVFSRKPVSCVFVFLCFKMVVNIKTACTQPGKQKSTFPPMWRHKQLVLIWQTPPPCVSCRRWEVRAFASRTTIEQWEGFC